MNSILLSGLMCRVTFNSTQIDDGCGMVFSGCSFEFFKAKIVQSNLFIENHGDILSKGLVRLVES